MPEITLPALLSGDALPDLGGFAVMRQPQPSLKPNLLCIVPPYLSKGAPPLGPAALLGYLRSQGCDDFDFLDLRLWVPNAYAPTYSPVGVFGETYVIDVPDLPLVLQALE